MYGWHNYERMPLPQLEKELREMFGRLKSFGQNPSLTLMEPLWQMVLNFMGQCSMGPSVLTGAVMDEEASTLKAKKSNPNLICWINYCAMVLEYCFGNYEAAELKSRKCKELLQLSCGGMDAAGVLFFEGMTQVALARKNKGKGRKTIRRVRRHLKRLRKWALHSPENFHGKQLLLEAELAAFSGNSMLAMSKYRSAIIDCRDAGFLLEEALANERFAKYLSERGERSSASKYIHEAIRVYTKWGAAEKVVHLKLELHRELYRERLMSGACREDSGIVLRKALE